MGLSSQARLFEADKACNLAEQPGHDTMHVLHVAAECFPVVKVGGLADVVGALPRYLIRRGLQASVLIPWYGHLDPEQVRRVGEGELWIADRRHRYRIWRDQSGWTPFPLYLLEYDGFRPPGVYADPDTGKPFENELARYAVLGHAAAALAAGAAWRTSELTPIDLVHGHDHHAAFTPLWMRYGVLRSEKPFVLTVHNALYQGRYPWAQVEALRWPAGLPRSSLDHDGAFNALKAALLLAERVTTVSPTYARELAEWAGGGLEYVFQEIAPKLLGILNGIDPECWNPAQDANLAVPYDARHLERRQQNKRALGWRLGLSLDANAFLMAFIGRLVPEKGVELVLEVVPRWVEAFPEARLVVLGTGWPDWERAFRELEATYPERVRAWLRFDEGLAHLLYGSADVLLMPSRTEPCGLNQLYALRYGCIPIVHPTGGLRDTIRPLEQDPRNGTGFWMAAYGAEALFEAIGQARSLWCDPVRWRALQRRAMREDFSWDRSASAYQALYEALVTR